MEPWELTEGELSKVWLNQSARGSIRAIATAAAQKARDVTAWEIVDWLRLTESIPYNAIAADRLARELKYKHINRIKKE